MSAKKIRVLHIVKWFYAGGGERLLSGLLEHSDHDRYEHVILSLSDQHERLAQVQHTLNIPYKAIEIERDKLNVIAHLKCLAFVLRTRPDIIKGWLPPSNITGGVLGKILRIPVIWGIHSAMPADAYTRQKFSLSRFLSPRRIVCCSPPVYDLCREIGYSEKQLCVIINGTDTERFSPKPTGRKRIRQELGLSDDVLLIGMAAEYTPVKRHIHFLAAAKIFLTAHPAAHFLLCGKDASGDNPDLKTQLQLLGLQDRVHALGIRNDMADIYSALDIHTLNSQSESFGLAITEAMACKTLCAATDVGMIKTLLEEVGEVIPVSDNPDGLVHAWKTLLQLTEAQKQERLEKGRNRIAQHYSIVETAKQYDALYKSVHDA